MREAVSRKLPRRLTSVAVRSFFFSHFPPLVRTPFSLFISVYADERKVRNARARVGRGGSGTKTRARTSNVLSSSLLPFFLSYLVMIQTEDKFYIKTATTAFRVIPLGSRREMDSGHRDRSVQFVRSTPAPGLTGHLMHEKSG